MIIKVAPTDWIIECLRHGVTVEEAELVFAQADVYLTVDPDTGMVLLDLPEGRLTR